MKLHEFTIPMDIDGPFDDMQARDNEDSMPHMKDKAFKDREKKPVPSRKNSNVRKARRLRSIINTLKRERSSHKDPGMETEINHGETDGVQLAPHGSNFLFR